MTMLRILLAKDLRRAWRNPIPYAIHLAMPILITALIGITFGPASQTGGLGRIKLGVVDEDDSPLSGFLRGAVNQREGSQYLEPVFVNRAEGMAQIADNKLSALVIIPRDFMRDYLNGSRRVTLELVKNPAQTFYPAIVEELLGALATGLSVVSRNLQSEFPEWKAAFDQPSAFNTLTLINLVGRTGNKIEAVKSYLFPPLVIYGKTTQTKESKAGPAVNLFAFLLPGLAAMFLLFIADNAIRDVYRELANHTFDRFRTLHHRLFVFVGSKVAFALAILTLCGAILFVGGALIFGFRWERPEAVVLLILAYALFCAGLMAALAALARNERRADLMNSIIAMGLGLAGGCAFPPQQLPTFVRDHITPYLPPYWFAEAVRDLQFHFGTVSWTWALAKLTVLGLLLVVAASWYLRQRLEKGARE